MIKFPTCLWLILGNFILCNIRKYARQELIAYEGRTYHQFIQAELESYGMQLLSEDDLIRAAHSFRCRTCSSTFATARQLAVHAFRFHGHHALESYYVQSEICPGCLQNFHTTYRVAHHLRYRPNQLGQSFCNAAAC